MTPPRGPCDKGTVPIHVGSTFFTSPPACPTVGLALHLEICGEGRRNHSLYLENDLLDGEYLSLPDAFTRIYCGRTRECVCHSMPSAIYSLNGFLELWVTGFLPKLGWLACPA